METIFQKAKQNRIFQDIVEQIQFTICKGILKPGDKLPPERELCSMFQASRGTLREALRILEQKSLLEIRLGVNGGAFVKEANADLMAENLGMLIQSENVSLAHLAEFREGLEGFVSGLAAERATQADINDLKKLIRDAERSYTKGIADWGNFVEIDAMLHMTIARVTGNPLYAFVLRSIQDNIHRYYDRLLSVDEHELKENYQDLRMIVYAIGQHDAVLASRLSREHVRRFTTYMEQKKRRSMTA